jgi:hypothetical protein
MTVHKGIHNEYSPISDIQCCSCGSREINKKNLGGERYCKVIWKTGINVMNNANNHHHPSSN